MREKLIPFSGQQWNETNPLQCSNENLCLMCLWEHLYVREHSKDIWRRRWCTCNRFTTQNFLPSLRSDFRLVKWPPKIICTSVLLQTPNANVENNFHLFLGIIFRYMDVLNVRVECFIHKFMYIRNTLSFRNEWKLESFACRAPITIWKIFYFRFGCRETWNA